MFVIVLTGADVSSTDNNTFIYNFPNSVHLKDKFITVNSVSMYYSWFNILEKYKNNTFTYTWTVGTTTTTYNIVFPDGIYNVSDMNEYLQWVMINNGTYLIDNTGDNVYYAEIYLNVNRYSVQINTFQVPLSLPIGYTLPSNFVGFPSQTFNPIITIPAYFNDLIGYTVGFTTNDNINNSYVPPVSNKSNNYVKKEINF